MKNIYNKISFILFSLLLLTVGCEVSPIYKDRVIEVSGNHDETQENKKIEYISVPNKYVWFEKGTEKNINAEISNNSELITTQKINNKEELVYTSSDNKVVTVDEFGKLTYISNGIAIISIKSVNNSADPKYVLVNTMPKKKVSNPEELVTTIALDFGTAADIYLDKKPNFYMYARALPLYAKDKTLKYVSLNTEIVKVNEKGFIEGIKEGNTDIITYSESNPEKYAIMNISVYKSKPVIGNVYEIPEGLTKIEMSDSDPLKALSLIGSYYIVNSIVEGEDYKVPERGSELRVNADLSDMGNGNVNILIYIKLNDKEVSVKLPRPLGESLDIKGIFESLGAKITGDYTLQFTLDPKDYGRVSEFGLVEKGKTLILNLQKYKELEALAEKNPMGDDVTFDPTSKPSVKDVPSINFPTDPFSLIAKYEIKNYIYNDGELKTPTTPSEFRVNANLNSSVGVNIEMYLKLNGRIYSFVKEKKLEGADLNVMIENVFNSLGAKVTGSYTLDFTLDSSIYPELVKTGFMKANEKLLIKLEKYGVLEPLGGLGDVEENKFDAPESSENDKVEPEIPDLPEIHEKAEVERIILNYGHISPEEKNQTVQLKTVILPEDAENKTLTWESSDNKIATVTQSGLVKILKNDNAIITATAKNGVKAEFKIDKITKPRDFKLNIDAIELIIGINDEFDLSYSYVPSILTGEGLNIKLIPEATNLVQVDETIGRIKAIDAGETTVKVQIGNISKDLHVRILEKPDKIINVEGISLDKKVDIANIFDGTYKINASVKPLSATNKKINYIHNCPNITIDSIGNIKMNSTGKCSIQLQAVGNEKIKENFVIDVQEFAKDIKFAKREFGIKVDETFRLEPIFEGNPSSKEFSYEVTPTGIIEVSKDGIIKGKKPGKAKIYVTTPYGLNSYFDVSVYTPFNFSNPKSLNGTYEVVYFEQKNGTLDVCSRRNGNCGGIERMIGEATINIDSNNDVTMYLRNQMDSSSLDNFKSPAGGFGEAEARQGQFSIFKFENSKYSSDGFGGIGDKLKGRVTQHGELLQVHQKFQEGPSFYRVDVNIYMHLKKKSDNVKDITARQLYWSKSGENYNIGNNASKHFSGLIEPIKEPYYKEGLTGL